MEAWGNSSGQPLGLDFDSQARWKLCRYGKEMEKMVVMIVVIKITWLNSVHSIIFHGNASNIFRVLETPNKLDPCCRPCTGGSLCLWCCTSSDLSDCACWCLSYEQTVAQTAQMALCSVARCHGCHGSQVEREGGTFAHQIDPYVKECEMSWRSWVGVELRSLFGGKWWVSIWDLYVVSCRYEQSQFLGPNSLCLSRQPMTQRMNRLLRAEFFKQSQLSQLGDVVWTTLQQL